MSRYEESEQAYAVKEILNITLLASEWKSVAGGLSTFNRELAIHLAQIQNVRVSLLVPQGACDDEDKEAARSFGISILDAKKCVAFEPLLWLSNPPQDHKIDVIVGHGVKLGRQVQLIKRHVQFQHCNRIHVVHTAPEDLSKYKGYSGPISRGEERHWDEVDLCKCADLVVPVGPRLGKAYHSYLQEGKTDEEFFELIPGLFEREFGDLPAKQKPKDGSDDFIVLLCGRGDEEDFELKGYNTAVKAFADQRLKGKHYSLLFVGSPEGKQDEVRERLLKYGITNEQLTVREFVKSRERMKELFCEVDMVIMPSKSEGFGLVALEALSAGLPILVGNNSGFARAMKSIPNGKYIIVGDSGDSGDPAKWAEAIEDVRERHRMVLRESKLLKECYSEEYCWKKQCEELVARLWKMVYEGTSSDECTLLKLQAMQQDIEEGAVTSGREFDKNVMLLTQTTHTDYEELCKLDVLGLRDAADQDQTVVFEEFKERLTRSPEGWYETILPWKPNHQYLPSNKENSLRRLQKLNRKLEREGLTKDYDDIIKDQLAEGIIEKAPPVSQSNEFYIPHKSVIRKSAETTKTRIVYDASSRATPHSPALNDCLYPGPVLQNKLWDILIQQRGYPVILAGDIRKAFLQIRIHKSYSGFYLTRMDTSGIAKMLRSEQQLPSVSLETFHEPHNSMHESEVNEENKALATHGNGALGGFGGEVDKTPSFAQQSVLDQGTSILGMASAAGNKEVPVKQEDTDWMTRKEKARVKQENTDWMIRMKNARFLLTPLHLACWYGQESVVKLLLEHGADVNATDKFQFTPLHKAERRNHHSIVKLLLDHKARPTLQQPPSLRTLGRRAFTRPDEHSGFNLLQAAVLEGDDDTVTKASVHLENFMEEMNYRTTGEKASIFPGKSAAGILLAVKWEMESYYLISKICKELVETEKTLTRLHSCAKRNDLEMAIELVLNDGIDINVAAKRNITPLVWASPAASGLSIKTLIDLGADVNAQTFQEKYCDFCSGTALRSAIHGNNAAVVKVLLANKADANIADQQGNTVLHLSTSKRFFNISQLLIDSGCKINGRNNSGETSLHSAVYGKNVADVKFLLRNNADANIQDNQGNTLLHISTREGLCDISQLLVDSGCKINGENNRGETPLHSTLRGENVADVKLLLRNNADANIQDIEGNAPLHISTREGLCDISQLLVGSGCKINGGNNRGETPLHSAVRGNNVADVKLLLRNNADANIQDIERNAPLHTSTREGLCDISQLLIDSGCKINVRNNVGETPLHSAVRAKNVADVKLLLRNNADANIQDNQGNTPLHISTREGLCDISQFLVDSGCKINVRNKVGKTPLHSAVRAKNVADVKLLLRNNADANIQDNEGNTPLHISTREGLCDISQLLIDSGCKVNVRNKVGKTPLHSAVRGKNVADVNLLLRNNADTNIQDNRGNTPLHISTRERLCDFSQLLVDSGCKINVRNNVRETPLHSAIRSKNLADVELLLSNNADANIEDNQGNTPLHISTREGL
ncbi:ankyrin-3-like, partial [Acropora millepora]|uniref:ankyrin-3-like n=1 Tax=Acropora millepora TaxID=45264 RepID=UPI001CF398E9